MSQLPNRRFTPEFKQEAVALVAESGLSIHETAKRLEVASSTLHRWIQEAKGNTVAKANKYKHPVSREEAEISRLLRENAELRMERDILKKAAVFFAKESR